MTIGEKKNLVEKYAPIMWFHEDEAFIPEDCKIMAEVADAYRGKKKIKFDRTLDSLGRLQDSKECSLDIPDLDLHEFKIPLEYSKGITELGPEAVARLARERYGNNPASGFPEKDTAPKYYARVGRVSLHDKKGDPFSEYFRNVDRTVLGTYTVIQYFFFYIFNDSWNKHECDWDSTIEILINEDTRREFLICHMHHTTWLAEIVIPDFDIQTWLNMWNTLNPKKEIGKAFVLSGHPYVFVASGAHGAYPTPGFSIHGVKAKPFGILLASVDERQIGRACIIPDCEEMSEELIRTNLRFSRIEANRIRFMKWREPELLVDQPWLKYRGKWGQEAKFSGWSGSPGSWITRPISETSLKSRFREGYDGIFIDKILQNWHGVR